MLLYTNKANNVFDFVDEKFVDRDISAIEGLKRLAAVLRQAQAAKAA
ncbi:hypothetical protein [Pseudomonas sp. LT1P18]